MATYVRQFVVLVTLISVASLAGCGSDSVAGEATATSASTPTSAPTSTTQPSTVPTTTTTAPSTSTTERPADIFEWPAFLRRDCPELDHTYLVPDSLELRLTGSESDKCMDVVMSMVTDLGFNPEEFASYLLVAQAALDEYRQYGGDLPAALLIEMFTSDDERFVIFAGPNLDDPTIGPALTINRQRIP